MSKLEKELAEVKAECDIKRQVICEHEAAMGALLASHRRLLNALIQDGEALLHYRKDALLTLEQLVRNHNNHYSPLGTFQFNIELGWHRVNQESTNAR